MIGKGEGLIEKEVGVRVAVGFGVGSAMTLRTNEKGLGVGKRNNRKGERARIGRRDVSERVKVGWWLGSSSDLARLLVQLSF